MPVNMRKMADLKDRILSKIDDNFLNLSLKYESSLSNNLKLKTEVEKHSKTNWKKGRVRVNSFSASTTC